MTLNTVAIALAASLFGQAPASSVTPPDLFPDWRTLCVQHRGDVAAPIAQADGLGWQMAPPDMLKQLPETLKGVQGRYMFDAGAVEFVLTGTGAFPVGGRKVNAAVCMVGARPADASALVAKASAFFRVPAVPTEPGQTVLAFTGDGADRRPVDVKDDKAAIAAIESGAATVVLVQAFEGGAMLAYAVPTR